MKHRVAIGAHRDQIAMRSCPSLTTFRQSREVMDVDEAAPERAVRTLKVESADFAIDTSRLDARLTRSRISLACIRYHSSKLSFRVAFGGVSSIRRLSGGANPRCQLGPRSIESGRDSRFDGDSRLSMLPRSGGERAAFETLDAEDRI